MHDGMAIPMKVQTLLSYRSSGESERPKWRVERVTYGVNMHASLGIMAGSTFIGLAAGEVLTHGIGPSLYSGRTVFPLDYVQPPSGQSQNFAQRSHQV